MARKKTNGKKEWLVAVHIDNDKNNGKGDGKVFSFPSIYELMGFIADLEQQYGDTVHIALPAKCPVCGQEIQKIVAASVAESDGTIRRVKKWYSCNCDIEGPYLMDTAIAESVRFLEEIHRSIGDVFPGYEPGGEYKTDPQSKHFLLLTKGHAEV